jgi:predicted molibdopterin-dependent oxidoreductase YjgC
MARFTVNGKVAEAREGTSVLEAARGAGIDVPTFCHHDALGPFGACRLCVVEVEGAALARTVLPACTLPVSEGLVVETDTGPLQLFRKTIVQLLVSSLPPTEALERVAHRFGVTVPPFTNDRPDACALCGLCVRVCRDRIGAAALAFRGDGTRRWSVAERVVLDPQACVGCGTCAVLCPVSAIAVEDRGAERCVSLYGVIVSRLERVRCSACGVPHATRRFQDLVSSRLDPEQRRAASDLGPACAREQRAAALSGTGLGLED